jgi:glycosyltransferase involved in cell wall biosynthesis
VVRNGVDIGRFDPAVLPAPRDARRKLGVRGEARLVVCVGRLCRQKGQDLLLRAWPRVRAALPDAELALVGDGPDREELERQAEGLPGVRFAGAVPDPRDWYAAADLVVQPSRWEGMALAPLEAMACARPVLLTDVPGARECLGESELPLAVGDIVELASGISHMLADLDRCRRLGSQARARVAERHRLSESCAAVARVYAELRRQLPVQGDPARESLTNSSTV